MSALSGPAPLLPAPLEALARDLALAVEPATFLAVLEAGGPGAQEEAAD